ERPENLPKAIFYFKSRRLARRAVDILRLLLPEHLRSSLYAYTAVYSDKYKEKVMKWFRTGQVRWLFCTDAAGMGCDIPDIEFSVVYGVDDLCSAMQKGGRAGRMPGMQARMIWLIE
ncbi:hypothetical protein SCHPADRAFT_809818, partial [Schizopora paradoxa]